MLEELDTSNPSPPELPAMMLDLTIVATSKNPKFTSDQIPEPLAPLINKAFSVIVLC